MGEDLMSSIKRVQTLVLEMHRHILEALKSDRENHFQKSVGPTEWLQLIISGPEYRWLQAVTRLMSDTDALIDNQYGTPENIAILRAELENFFLKGNTDPESFNSRYRELLTKNNDMMLSHGHLRQAIMALPGTTGPVVSEENGFAIRQAWHKKLNQKN